MKELQIKETISDFINYCDDMINGKFIMADSKISKILGSIANNPRLYALINDCLKNYNFHKEYEKSLGEADNGIYEVSQDLKKNIAFVMCIFVEVDHHRIKFYDFISRFFKNAGAGNEYAEFVRTMLKPFKEGVMSQYEIGDFVTIQTQTVETQDVVDIFQETIDELKILRNEINFSKKISSKKKEEIDIYILGTIEALKLKNKKIISALITALNKELFKEKSIKETYSNLTRLFLKIYE